MDSTPTLRELFETALQLSGAARMDWLAAHCLDPQQREEIERMLSADTADDDWLPGDAGDRALSNLEKVALLQQAGFRITRGREQATARKKDKGYEYPIRDARDLTSPHQRPRFAAVGMRETDGHWIEPSRDCKRVQNAAKERAVGLRRKLADFPLQELGGRTAAEGLTGSRGHPDDALSVEFKEEVAGGESQRHVPITLATKLGDDIAIAARPWRSWRRTGSAALRRLGDITRNRRGHSR